MAHAGARPAAASSSTWSAGGLRHAIASRLRMISRTVGQAASSDGNAVISTRFHRSFRSLDQCDLADERARRAGDGLVRARCQDANAFPMSWARPNWSGIVRLFPRRKCATFLAMMGLRLVPIHLQARMHQMTE